MQCNGCPCLALPAKRSNRLQMLPQWALVGFCVALRHTLSGLFRTHRVHVLGGLVVNWRRCTGVCSAASVISGFRIIYNVNTVGYFLRLLVQLALAFLFGVQFHSR